ncbi:MAG TPA: EamA family transporter [Candidatus Thermoplasmatota archaeon]|nr:EamA family transporter [Candidatus Thermoplasmatota archaeon]
MRASLLRPLAFALLCLVWGSTWLVIKVGYGGLGPFNVAAARFLLAGVVMAALVPLLGARWPRGRREWALALFVGAVLFAVDYGLIYWGEQWLDSGLTAVLFATNPLATALLAHVALPGERATARKLGGTLVAFLGVVALFAGSLRLDARLALPMLAIVGAAVAGALGTVATKLHGKGLHPAGLNAPAMLAGGLLLLLASWAAGERPRVPAGAGAWGAVVYLALAGSVVTFLLYFWLLQAWPATTLSLIAVVVPLVALLLGHLALGETPTAWTGVGTVLILAGVALALGVGRRAGAPG